MCIETKSERSQIHRVLLGKLGEAPSRPSLLVLKQEIVISPSLPCAAMHSSACLHRRNRYLCVYQAGSIFVW